jgi:hypothetical protein
MLPLTDASITTVPELVLDFLLIRQFSTTYQKKGLP